MSVSRSRTNLSLAMALISMRSIATFPSLALSTKRPSEMADLTPRLPAKRPLQWPDRLSDLQEALLDLDLPPLYIVGGAVRDALLNRPVYDFDLAAPAGDAIKVAR